MTGEEVGGERAWSASAGWGLLLDEMRREL